MPTVEYGVLIGRFQPFHFGHLQLVKNALNECEKLIIMVGSSNRPRLERNPWTFVERKDLIEAALDEVDPLLCSPDSGRVRIKPLPDRLYDYPAWLAEVQHVVGRATSHHVAPSIGLFGHKRDHTSFYLDDFPEWKPMLSDDLGIQATSLRKAYFQNATPEMFAYLDKVAPATTVDFLRSWRGNKALGVLLDDMRENADYKIKWGMGPHSTVDSVFLRSGRILMVRRGSAPGKGLRALPGGFLNLDETLLDGSLRELSEETLIDLLGIPNLSVTQREHAIKQMLRAAYRGREIFDDPHRSERARIITTAHLFDLGNGHLPPVTGADDAVDAEWVRIDQIKDDECFDDHSFIIRKMLSTLGKSHGL